MSGQIIQGKVAPYAYASHIVFNIEPCCAVADAYDSMHVRFLRCRVCRMRAAFEPSREAWLRLRDDAWYHYDRAIISALCWLFEMILRGCQDFKIPRLDFSNFNFIFQLFVLTFHMVQLFCLTLRFDFFPGSTFAFDFRGWLDTPLNFSTMIDSTFTSRFSWKVQPGDFNF